MFTVIIPTMWRAPGVFLQALQNYIRSDFVSEIIIIDNDYTKRPFWPDIEHPKVNVIMEHSNTFVNPAWNKGVEMAKNDKVCIANDDIVFDTRLFAKMYDRVTPENGVHGIISGEDIFNHPPTTDGSIDFIAWKPWDNIHCFGQLMFLHKDNWKPIIPGLDIYFGDDFIFHNHLQKGLTNYLIYNIHFFSPMASTSKDTNITGGILEKEQPIWVEYFNNNPIAGL